MPHDESECLDKAYLYLIKASLIQQFGVQNGTGGVLFYDTQLLLKSIILPPL